MKSHTKVVSIVRRPVRLGDPNRAYKKCSEHGNCIHRLKRVFDDPCARFRWFCEKCNGQRT